MEADWERMIRDHDRRVVLSLVALGLPFDRAKDIAHAAWVRLMEGHRAGKLGELRLPGLAIVQARFLALDDLRREAAEHRRRGDVEPPIPIERLDPERRLLSKEEARRALAAVAASPPSTQKLFRLLYREPGISHAGAAAEMGLSVQRVRQIVCELRKRVRTALEESES